MKIDIEFTECEHYDDLDNYLKDIVSSGGNIINSTVNFLAEIGIVSVECDSDFFDKFKKTSAYEFSSLYTH